MRSNSADRANCAKENLRWLLSSPICSFSLPNDTSTIGSFFQSWVSSCADKTKSFGCHLRPVLSAYVDLPVIRISVSLANVSIGLRRPPSWIASNAHCLKSRSRVSAAHKCDANMLAAAKKIAARIFKCANVVPSAGHVESGEARSAEEKLFHVVIMTRRQRPRRHANKLEPSGSPLPLEPLK